jgi:hypothetical protein
VHESDLVYAELWSGVPGQSLDRLVGCRIPLRRCTPAGDGQVSPPRAPFHGYVRIAHGPLHRSRQAT